MKHKDDTYDKKVVEAEFGMKFISSVLIGAQCLLVQLNNLSFLILSRYSLLEKNNVIKLKNVCTEF